MFTSFRNGHATVARLVRRSTAAQHVRAKTSAARTRKAAAANRGNDVTRGAAPEEAESMPEYTRRITAMLASESLETLGEKPAKRKSRRSTAAKEGKKMASWEASVAGNKKKRKPRTSTRETQVEMEAGDEEGDGEEEDGTEVKRTRRAAAEAMFQVSGPVARKLANANIWNRRRLNKKDDRPRVVDPRRVNIVSSALCDSIVQYLGPSLERHRGCDLVDLNPGVGLWSSKLHEFLEPRKHVLMDLDAELYQPHLSGLLEKDNVELVPKSGIVWRDLLETMHTRLTGQTKRDKVQAPTRNDTLLVTANLSMYPKKTFQGFDSVSTMVLYQLLSSIRTSSLFQEYGLVRMLVWINDEDKKRILPRSLVSRRRSAFEAELSCEWVHEVAGMDKPEDRCSLRDWWINAESAYRCVERMEAQGLTMPPARATKAYTDCISRPELKGQELAGVRPPDLNRPFKVELEQLERIESENRDLVDADVEKRLKVLRARNKLALGDSQLYARHLEQYRKISQLAASSPSEFRAAEADWNEQIDSLKKNLRTEFKSIKDNYILFRQDPPAMLWDRRALEPLSAHPDEFFPNAPTSLLDIQPKAMRPLLRQYGPASSRSGDMSDIMLRFWYQHTLFPAAKAMDGLWSGFGDLAAQCPSLTDPARGGSPLSGHGALVSRAMNEQQWADILQAWAEWPFRPTYVQMLGRMVEEVDADEEDDTKSGAMSSTMF